MFIFNSQNFHNSFFFGNFTTRLKRNSEIRNTKFPENWPLNFWPSNVTYTAYTHRHVHIHICTYSYIYVHIYTHMYMLYINI